MQGVIGIRIKHILDAIAEVEKYLVAISFDKFSDKSFINP